MLLNKLEKKLTCAEAAAWHEGGAGLPLIVIGIT